MKNINLLSLVQAYRSLQRSSFICFLSYYGIKIRKEEVEDLDSLLKNLIPLIGKKYLFNHFYVGYLIPQIGKEFDLLRLGKDYIINLELKKTATHEKIRTQLIRNKYYLSFTQKEIHTLCFQSDTNELFHLNENGDLENSDFSFLIKLLDDQQIDDISNIDSLFNPSNYLISPFNNPDKFINNEYFLTKHQEAIRNEILEALGDDTKAIFISWTSPILVDI